MRLLAPIDPRANKVPAIAANYGERDERDGPGIFMKQPGTVVGPGEPIVYPRIGRSIIHEAEVGIVIGKSARHVSVDDALDHVLGYTCVNDVSARELASSDLGRGTSMRWKHFDTFCPIGPWIVTGLDGDNLGIECRVNGETVVDGLDERHAVGSREADQLGVRGHGAAPGRHHPKRVPCHGRDSRGGYIGRGGRGYWHAEEPGRSGPVASKSTVVTG